MQMLFILAVLFSMSMTSWGDTRQCESDAVTKERALAYYAAVLRVPADGVEILSSESLGTSGVLVGPAGRFKFVIYRDDCSLSQLIRQPIQSKSIDPEGEPDPKCPNEVGKRLALFSAWAISQTQRDLLLSESSSTSISRASAKSYPLSWKLGAIDYHVAFYASAKVATYFVKFDDTCGLNYIVAIP